MAQPPTPTRPISSRAVLEEATRRAAGDKAPQTPVSAPQRVQIPPMQEAPITSFPTLQPPSPPAPAGKGDEKLKAPDVEEEEEDADAPAPDETPEDRKMRTATEARLAPLDIGEYIIRGHFEQVIPIIPGHYTVVLRTSNDNGAMERAEFLADRVANANASRRLSQGEVDILELRAIIAAYLVEIRVGTSHTQMPRSLAARMDVVANIPDPIRRLIWLNIRWFEQRVAKMLRASVVKNG